MASGCLTERAAHFPLSRYWATVESTPLFGKIPSDLATRRPANCHPPCFSHYYWQHEQCTVPGSKPDPVLSPNASREPTGTTPVLCLRLNLESCLLQAGSPLLCLLFVLRNHISRHTYHNHHLYAPQVYSLFNTQRAVSFHSALLASRIPAVNLFLLIKTRLGCCKTLRPTDDEIESRIIGGTTLLDAQPAFNLSSDFVTGTKRNVTITTIIPSPSPAAGIQVQWSQHRRPCPHGSRAGAELSIHGEERSVLDNRTKWRCADKLFCGSLHETWDL